MCTYFNISGDGQMADVFIVAADPEVLQAFESQLRPYPLRVLCTSDIQALQAQFEQHSPVLLLVDLDAIADLFLPVYLWIEHDERFSSIPKIFVSGRASAQSKLVAFLEDHPQESVLKKPLQRASFVSRLQSSVERAQLLLADRTEGSAGLNVPNRMPQEPLPTTSQAFTRAWKGRQIGNITLEHELGRGGMGTVFLGFQKALDRHVAVKMILPELIHNARMMTRFQREALAIARLKSPYVVQVFDAGFTEEGAFYMVMEYLEGLDLEIQLRKKGAFSTSETLHIATQALEGLSVAHSAGIVHRDIKPSNLVLSPESHLTLTDFGLAQQNFDMRFTQEGTMLGTPYYFSPEQAAGQTIDARSDLYSLGIVLFELLTGHVPFMSDNLTELLYAHTHYELPDPRDSVADIPEDVVQILRRMSAKKPEDRYVDAESALLAVREARGDAHPMQNGHHSNASVSVGSSDVFSASSTSSSERASLALPGSGAVLPLDPSRRMGSFLMRSTGEIQTQGELFATAWVDSTQVLLAIVHQIESIVQMGVFQYILCESASEVLVLITRGAQAEGMVFSLHSVPSVLRMSVPLERSAVRSQSLVALSPLEQLRSIVGVDALILLAEDGRLCDSTFSSESHAQALAHQWVPILSLLSSLPLQGVDCCFSQGRILLWKVQHRYLVIWSTHKLNKSLLALLIQQQQDVLLSLAPIVPVESMQSSSWNAAYSEPVTPSSPLHSALTATDSFSSISLEGVDAPPSDGPLVSKDALRSVSQIFAQYIGPMAKLLLKKELKKLGFSASTLPESEVGTLFERLGARLDADKRDAFLEEVKALHP